MIESGRPIAQVARELGINEGTLGDWVWGPAGPGRCGCAVDRLGARRVVRLRRELAEAQMERDVLKRSVALWVKEAMGR